MIEYTHNEEKQVGNTTYIWFIGDCLSTDFKPVDHVYEGSKLFEKDTLKQYIWRSSENKWIESCNGPESESESGSSSESSSGSGILFTNVIMGDVDNPPKLDKTCGEILDAGFAIAVIRTIRDRSISSNEEVTFCPLSSYFLDSEGVYRFAFSFSASGGIIFAAHNLSDYPEILNDGPAS